MPLRLALLLALATCAFAQAPTQRELWNRPQQPFQIHGNTYYVGPQGLSAILITSPQGHILIDAALPESASLIAANIAQLGFRLTDVKLILNSHVHYDHAGAIAELQRLSGAQVAASPWSASVLSKGGVGQGDPQAAVIEPIAPAKAVSTFSDGDILRVGPLAVTAHFTPGHIPGGTSWTWQSCANDACQTLVYADSVTAVSADRFLFTRDYPNAARDFAQTFAFLRATPCDILLTTHPEAANLGDPPEHRCRALADRGQEQFNRRLQSEVR